MHKKSNISDFKPIDNTFTTMESKDYSTLNLSIVIFSNKGLVCLDSQKDKTIIAL